ncbi:MAG: ATP-binding protein [Sandaracinaceae bacterium]
MSASHFLAWFLPPPLRSRAVDGQSRMRITVAVLLFLLCFALLMGAARTALGFRAPLVAPIALVVLTCLGLVRATGRVRFVGHVISGLLVGVFASLTLLAGTTASAAFLGFAIVALVATFLSGRWAGLAWTLVSLGVMGSLKATELGWVPSPVEAEPGRMMPALLSVILVLGAYGIAWAYEWSRTRDQWVLSQHADKTTSLLGALPEVVLEVDRDGICIALHGLRATSPPFSGALKRPLTCLFEADARSLQDALARVRANKATLELELDGEERTWNLRITPFREEVTLVVARDVTTARQLEAQLLEAEMRSSLERADRMSSIGILAAGMAHEINNPLAYLAGNLAVLEEGRIEETERLGALADARDAADRIRRIVDDLKVYARREEEAAEDEVVPLRKVADSALKLARNQLQHRAHVVVENSGAPLAIGSEARLVQVVLNLLVNAAQAIPPGSAAEHRVTLRTWQEGGRARVAVEDTGDGMAPHVLEKVTQPFFTTKPVGVGTGLGLSVCDGIIRQLGGTLSIDSTVGRGTCVEIALPLASATSQAALSLRPVTRSAPVAPGRILVVDDEPLVRRALRRMLRPHEVVEAESGREAEVLLGDDRGFDLILCDVMMPDGTGIELHDALEESAPELIDHFVFMTGGAFDGEVAELFGRVAPSRTVIQKPFRPDVLAALVAKQLSRPHVGAA